ncbi:unnamed protein product [Didymodactylos carnosus]|uniref:Uncharacterized protein n=1 Tax=Didymodactylos carnosus TaxID=1234261 RepID=A0A815YDU9_9BILA|nr:unnamed protein product [Didymodactylos carnosus]CAF1569459.1 unnamed protein product [Didymodactylos carnosus]CAF4261829.1 unnamed protein product [Didymodactylos carnosus]CAF4432483.1 unnamed protein product [Didymodactylos carnosus]
MSGNHQHRLLQPPSLDFSSYNRNEHLKLEDHPIPPALSTPSSYILLKDHRDDPFQGHSPPSMPFYKTYSLSFWAYLPNDDVRLRIDLHSMTSKKRLMFQIWSKCCYSYPGNRDSYDRNQFHAKPGTSLPEHQTWFHVLCEYDESTYVGSLYINGQKVEWEDEGRRTIVAEEYHKVRDPSVHLFCLGNAVIRLADVRMLPFLLIREEIDAINEGKCSFDQIQVESLIKDKVLSTPQT